MYFSITLKQYICINISKNGTAIAMIAGTVISILFWFFTVLGLKSAGYEIRN